MGLDMYLTGEKYFYTDWDEPENNHCEDGFRMKAKRFDLGYWRKHPDLHGFIVQTFAKGIDNCTPVSLGLDDILTIIGAIKEDRLPRTSGFFFGESINDDEEKAFAVKILKSACEWMKADEDSRSVYYQASW